MKLPKVVNAALIASAAIGFSSPAHADYPDRAITLIVPYAPGGSVDAFARVIAPELEARLGKPVIVDNVPGAGGIIGVAKGVRAHPDDYTILLGIVSDVVLAPLTESAARYTYRDLEPIASLGTSGVGVVANPALKITTLSELIAYAKKNPGKLSYGSTGAGSLPALAMEEVKRRADIKIEFIPYASASKIAVDVMGGHLDVGVSGLPALIEPIKGGRLTGVGVLSADRDVGNDKLVSTMDTPELAGMDFYFWTGLFGPKGTPEPVVNKLNAAFADVLTQAKVKARFADYGVKISPAISPKDFGVFVAQSNKTWEQLVKQSGVPKN